MFRQLHGGGRGCGSQTTKRLMHSYLEDPSHQSGFQEGRWVEGVGERGGLGAGDLQLKTGKAGSWFGGLVVKVEGAESLLTAARRKARFRI